MMAIKNATNTRQAAAKTLRTQVDRNMTLALDRWLATFPNPTERTRQVSQLWLPDLAGLTVELDISELTRMVESVGVTAGVRIINSIGFHRALEVFAQLGVFDAANVMRDLPGKNAHTILAELPTERADQIRELLKYDAESAGGNMTPSVLRAPINATAGEAMEAIRKAARTADVPSYVYLEDAAGTLAGVVSLRELVFADPQAPLTEVAQLSVRSVDADTDQEQVAQLIADYDLHAIPVLADGKLIGAVTADRAHDIMEEETTEDFARMSSLSSARSITNSSIGTLFRSRVTWLVILVFGNLFSGAGIAHFEDLIASAVTLVFFLPLLIDSGGNAGSQSATLMVRALAVGDVKLADWGRCLGKELGVALMLGVTMAAAVSVLGIYRGGPQVALVVALSMFLIVIVGCLIGMSLPFILAKLNMDPASASAPLITSICDGLGVIIYFTIANQLIL